MINNNIDKWYRKNAPKYKDKKYSVYIISSGKCASQALCASFSDFVPTLHAHTTYYWNNYILKTPNNPYTLMDYVNYSKFGEEILVINGNREPISRIISAFFQNLSVLLKKSDNEIRGMCLDEIMVFFKDKILYNEEQYSGAEEWIKDGLDIYDHIFDKEKKYQIIYHSNKTYINLLYEDISNWENIIKSNTIYKNFVLKKSGIRENDAYGDLYKQFNQEFKLNQAEIDKLYNLPFWKKQMEYYYPIETINKLKKRYLDTTIVSDNLLPKDKIIVPKDKIIVPKDKIIVPKDRIIVPKDKIIVPKDRIIVPKDKIIVPDNLLPKIKISQSRYLLPKASLAKIIVPDNLLPKYYLTIVSTTQNEGRFLAEWIEFHLLVGVEHFYLYDNRSTDNTTEVLKPYIDKGLVTYVFWTNPDPLTMAARSQGFHVAKKNSKWVALIDTDEFIVPNKIDDLRKLLSRYESYGGLVVNWQMFGTSGVQRVPDNRLMIDVLRKSSEYNHFRNERIKTIINAQYAIDIHGAHLARYVPNKYAVNSNYTRVDDASGPICINEIQLNHYYHRDLQFLKEIKVERLNRAYIQMGVNTVDTIDNHMDIDREYSKCFNGSIDRLIKSLAHRIPSISYTSSCELFILQTPLTIINIKK